MGITIHYKGEINSLDLIPKLIDDCQDFAKSMGWQYHVIDEQKYLPIKGIVLNIHPQAEPLNLTFGENGGLCSYIDYKQTQLFVKTQFAGIEAHITIVKLFKYLKKHYIFNLKVYDEGEYWETIDINKLSQKLSFLQSKIEVVKDVFGRAKFTKEKPHDILKLAEKIERILRETFENNKNS